MRLTRYMLATMFALWGAQGGFAQTPEVPNRANILKGIEACRTLPINFTRAACLDAANQFL